MSYAATRLDVRLTHRLVSLSARNTIHFCNCNPPSVTSHQLKMVIYW